MKDKTRRTVITGMLCALAYTTAVVGRVPMVLFLKYDPKDVVIAAGGLLFGPLTALAAAVTASLLEMLTVSENGILGCFMNIISSCSFACTAAIIHQKRRTVRGAALGLFCGWGCMVAVMLFWNYLIAPVYMGCSREAVLELMLPAFLPFNLMKGGLNMAVTMLLYRPVTKLAARWDRGVFHN